MTMIEVVPMEGMYFGATWLFCSVLFPKPESIGCFDFRPSLKLSCVS